MWLARPSTSASRRRIRATFSCWPPGRYEHGALSRGHGPAAAPRPLRRPRPDRDRHGQGPGQATPPVPELFVLPARPGVPAAPRGRAASGGDRVHRTGAEVGVFGGADPPHLLARGPARGRGLHALADRVRPAVLPVDGGGDQTVAAGRLPVAGALLPFAAAPVAVRQPYEGRRGGRRAAGQPGVSSPGVVLRHALAQLRQPPALGRVRLLRHCAGGRRVDATPPRAGAFLGLRLPVLRDPACDPNPLVASGFAGGDLDPVPAASRGEAVPSSSGPA